MNRMELSRLPQQERTIKQIDKQSANKQKDRKLFYYIYFLYSIYISLIKGLYDKKESCQKNP